MTSIPFSVQVKQAAHGRWFEILDFLEPTKLKDAIKNAPHHVPSPVRGGTDGFRFLKDGNKTGAAVDNLEGVLRNGFDLLIWLNDSTFSQELSRVAKFLGVTECSNKTALVSTKVDTYSYEPDLPSEEELQKRRLSLRKVWSGAYKLHTSKAALARKYLASRGLDVSKLNLSELSEHIRFHPNCSFWHKGKYYGSFPAIVSLVKNVKGEAVTIHRTYLNHAGNKLQQVVDGKYINNKKFMASCYAEKISGSAVRIGKPSKVLHIAEGLETALSVSQAINQKVWMCANSKLLGLLELAEYEEVTVIYDWADKDREYKGKRAGTDSAYELSKRMKERGIEVIPLFPESPIPENSKSVDWNDVLVEHGEEPFLRMMRYVECEYDFVRGLHDNQRESVRG